MLAVGILYVAAAFAVVPGLLLLFNRLSRAPETGSQEEVPFEDPRPPSLADEAERWLQGQP